MGLTVSGIGGTVKDNLGNEPEDKRWRGWLS